MKQIYTKLTTASKWKWMMTFLLLLMEGKAMAEDLGSTTITINSTYYWMSYIPTQNLYFNSSHSDTYTEPREEDCFAFKAVEVAGGVVKLKHVSLVQAGTPIWVWGKTKNHSVTTFSSLEDLKTLPEFKHEESIDFHVHNAEGADGNLLRGTLDETKPIKIMSGDYFLSIEDGMAHAATTAMIESTSENGYLPTGKVLLRAGENNAKLRLSILGDDDTAEGIDAVCTEKGELIMYDPNKPSYNAAGQLVPGDAKGLHIQNGYKFYIK